MWNYVSSSAFSLSTFLSFVLLFPSTASSRFIIFHVMGYINPYFPFHGLITIYITKVIQKSLHSNWFPFTELIGSSDLYKSTTL